MDGSQKIPQRWLVPLAINQAAGRRTPATLKALAAWIMFMRFDGRSSDDPMATQFADLWAAHGRDGIVEALFGEGGMFNRSWIASPESADNLRRRLLD